MAQQIIVDAYGQRFYQDTVTDALTPAPGTPPDAVYGRPYTVTQENPAGGTGGASLPAGGPTGAPPNQNPPVNPPPAATP